MQTKLYNNSSLDSTGFHLLHGSILLQVWFSILFLFSTLFYNTILIQTNLFTTLLIFFHQIGSAINADPDILAITITIKRKTINSSTINISGMMKHAISGQLNDLLEQRMYRLKQRLSYNDPTKEHLRLNHNDRQSVVFYSGTCFTFVD